MHAHFDLRLSDSAPQGSLHRWFCTLQGMADSWAVPTFSVHFHGFFELNIFWIVRRDAPQLSGVVELQFLDG